MANTKAVSIALTLAERRLSRQRRHNDPAPGQPRSVQGGDVLPGEWTPDQWGQPPDCPVRPLGMAGDSIYLVDAMGQLSITDPSGFGQGYIQRLFGDRQNYLYWAWPRRNKDGFIDNWRAERVRQSLYHGAMAMGPFGGMDRVRGRGAWREKRMAGGALIWHSGDACWRSDRRDRKGNPVMMDPGLVGDVVYEPLGAIMAPWPEAVSNAENPARGLLRALRSWNWTRPELDPVLMLGWIGAGMIGGALEQRPAIFVEGDKAVGKSTMHALLKAVFGNCMVQTADTSAAGIYQHIGHDSLPIAIDEIEARANNERTMAVINLARLAYSGAVLLRGGQNHRGVEFTARSSFFFSSINPPPLEPQDLSRMAMLRVRKLDASRSGEEPPVIDEETCGPMLLRVIFDNWERFDAARAAYRDVLRSAGHEGRGQDTFGTLLACADIMLGPDLADEMGLPMVDDLSKWGEYLAPQGMLEYEESSENWRKCLVHLLTSQVEAWRSGQRHTVGQLLDDLQADMNSDDDGRLTIPMASRLLAQAGLGLKIIGPVGPDLSNFALAIPNESMLLSKQFKDTVWAGAPGASVWKSALRQGPSNVVIIDKALNAVRINGVKCRCTLIDLGAFRKLEEAG